MASLYCLWSLRMEIINECPRAWILICVCVCVCYCVCSLPLLLYLKRKEVKKYTICLKYVLTTTLKGFYSDENTFYCVEHSNTGGAFSFVSQVGCGSCFCTIYHWPWFADLLSETLDTFHCCLPKALKYTSLCLFSY